MYLTKISKHEKNSYARKKSHIKSKKFHGQTNFLLKYYILIWKWCQNRLVPGWDVENLWFEMMFKIYKNTLFSKNIGHMKKKNYIYKIVLPFNFSIVSENLVQIGSLVTEIQNFGENICSISYDINWFRKLWPM